MFEVSRSVDAVGYISIVSVAVGYQVKEINRVVAVYVSRVEYVNIITIGMALVLATALLAIAITLFERKQF
jgi:hypothetical protein